MSALVPEQRKPNFEVFLTIHDLFNVPLLTGMISVKWKFNNSLTSRSITGSTEYQPVLDNKVTWNYKTKFIAKMLITKQNILKDSFVYFTVRLHAHSSKISTKMGTLRINLTEYIRISQDTRRYLLAESKVNATLRLSVQIQQLSGNADFEVTKTLNKPLVFSGITGLLTEGKEFRKREEDVGVSSNIAASEMERMLSSIKTFTEQTKNYYMHSSSNDFNSDQIVDDIYAGGNGWSQKPNISEIEDQPEDPFLDHINRLRKSWVLPGDQAKEKLRKS
ncbi:fungal protein [Schizosaccharomyces japonicus yFS275]|uniref:Fungal protein n=1 Tax=Schizosaccharomyces japonicus (strain yFS275 / FY16936) TaxID=402676 RepID=B6K7D9_SCHJY|nr:fungal protein [Schizosaccharomyces japonicus yFS275]EEB09443.1 fungal protein [Schizosaccharomyces japonicus yFS275]